MNKTRKTPVIVDHSSRSLFERIVAILDQARTNVVRSVNSNMVAVYWFIGQEIVQALQKGEERAEYGKRLINDLSDRLTKRYGLGYSSTNLKYFRTFYLAYADRTPAISHPLGDLLRGYDQKGRPMGDQSEKAQKSFHPNLSWSHYRALMRVENEQARDFYETESVRCGWDKRTLERQISTLFYERLLKSRNKSAMLHAASKTRKLEPVDVLKDPYILEYLRLPPAPELRESTLEGALIANLQHFLLELGKGFSFVARQKHLRIGSPDDNPTIGLILCSEKDDAIVHYSVLKENQKLFASRYQLVLPDEKALRQEIERERRLIENISRDGAGLRKKSKQGKGR